MKHNFDPDETIDLLALLVVTLPIFVVGVGSRSLVFGTYFPVLACLYVFVVGVKRIRSKKTWMGKSFLVAVLLAGAVLTSMAGVSGVEFYFDPPISNSPLYELSI